MDLKNCDGEKMRFKEARTKIHTALTNKNMCNCWRMQCGIQWKSTLKSPTRKTNDFN